ncbi:MAG: T9SS type A sorting domain-containing protein [Bacteroidota bacterium]
MNKLYYLIIMLLTCKICSGQNLIPNPDFEQYEGCPNSLSQFDTCMFWLTASGGTSDYYNQCDTNWVDVPNSILGYQPAHSGGAYAGIILYSWGMEWREYIEIQLLSPLVANSCYHFEMYVNKANRVQYAAYEIGAYFSNTLVHASYGHHLPLIPQINNYTGFLDDTLNWRLISGDYTAAGGENFITIGNFWNDAVTNFYIADSNASDLYAYVYIDDVSLSICTPIEEQTENSEISLYPNPLAKQLHVATGSYELSEIILYDIASRKLLQQSFTNSISLNTEQLSKGIYFYEVRNKNGVIKKGKVVKD